MSKNVPSTAEGLYRTYFPYGLRKMPSGKYFIFNREYQPVGHSKRIVTSIHDSDSIPEDFCVSLDMSDGIRASLAVPHSDPDFIYLYSDKTNPIQGGASLEIYLDKLRVLLALKSW